MRGLLQMYTALPSRSLRGLQGNPSVSIITAQGVSVPVTDAVTLANYLNQGADVLVNGQIVQPTESSSASGPVWMVNGQPLCNLFGTCGPASSIATPISIVTQGAGNGVVTTALTPNMIPSDSSGQAASAVPLNSAAYQAAATAAAIAPSQQPNQSGSTPSGTGSGYSTIPANCLGGVIYRFILNNNGIFQTGANRGGCSQTNSGACDPQTFSTLSQAIQYALANGETPYQVFSASDPWAIMNCQMAINPAQIYNADGSQGITGLLGGLSTTDILIGLGLAYFLLRKK